MRLPVLNRDFQHPADGWYQIETPGEHPNAGAGVLQVIDRTAVASIVNRFNQEADDYQRQTGREFPGMLIDHEHFKNDPEKETTAYGWLMRLENRGGVPYGKINWTGTGKPAVDGGDYRFFSTEYDPADLKVLNDGKPRRVRPMRLGGLTLTNQPNNQGGAPITNRAGAAVKKNHLQPGAENFPTPDLDKWFAAVVSIQQSAGVHHVALAFNQAWKMARRQFPQLYAAAFGECERAAESGQTSADMAGKQIATLVNRMVTARLTYPQAYELVKENCPAIYNRMMNRSAAIESLHRDPENHGPERIQNRAARILIDLASEENRQSLTGLGAAMMTVQQANPELALLAKGEITVSEAIAKEPSLRNRLL